LRNKRFCEQGQTTQKSPPKKINSSRERARDVVSKNVIPANAGQSLIEWLGLGLGLGLGS